MHCTVVAIASLDDVIAANAAFYAAFESGDMDAMSDVWEHSDRVSCVHPGWNRLHGWAAVAASWFALFQNGQHLQFIITNEQVELDGDLAWVSCDENLLSDQQVGGTVAALNLFARTDDGWKLHVHHGSPVVDRA